jgi:hypothetical protein
MNPPTINDAKKMAMDARALGVLILAFGGGQFGASSYGMTRPLCDAMRKVNERIAELIANGTIEIPDALRGKK